MIALYPGSFDPPHVGHLDIIRRAAAVVHQLLVGVATHPDKKSFLTIEQRLSLLTTLTADIPQVRVVAYDGATVHFARRSQCQVLIRGVRSEIDLHREQPMATINRDHGIDTIFFSTRPEYSHVSSSAVRMALQAGVDISAWLPEIVRAAVKG